MKIMRQIICEKNQAPLAPPSGPIAICRKSSAPGKKQPIRAAVRNFVCVQNVEKFI